MREQVARALYGKGVALGRLNRHVEALEAFEEVVARYGDVADLPLRELLVKAKANKEPLNQINE